VIYNVVFPVRLNITSNYELQHGLSVKNPYSWVGNV
jgi:hypothetical protein